MSSLAGEALGPAPARSVLVERTARVLCVCLLLVFSQGWVAVMLGADADPDASGWIRTAYFPWYAIALGLLCLKPRWTVAAAIRNPLLWCLMGLVFASTLWSNDPSQTERRAVALLFTTLAGLAIGSRNDWPGLAETLATAFACLAVASLIVGAAMPGIGRMSDIFPGTWKGVFFDKNGLGDNMALGFIVCCAAAALRPERRRLWLGFAGLTLLMLLLSSSKTSLVSMALGACTLALVAAARRGPAMAVVATFVAVVAVGLIACLILFDADLMLGLLGKDATLTGRTQIWAAVLNQIHKRPWTGYGYGAIWTDESGWGPLAFIVKQISFRPHHAHNGWLDAWLGLGYGGLALFAALVASAFVAAILTLYRSRGAYLALPFVVVYGLVSLTESVAFVYNDFIWLLFTAITVRLSMPKAWPPPEGGARPELRSASTAP